MMVWSAVQYPVCRAVSFYCKLLQSNKNIILSFVESTSGHVFQLWQRPLLLPLRSRIAVYVQQQRSSTIAKHYKRINSLFLYSNYSVFLYFNYSFCAAYAVYCLLFFLKLYVKYYAVCKGKHFKQYDTMLLSHNHHCALLEITVQLHF